MVKNRTKRGLLYGTASIIALMLLFPLMGELVLNSSFVRRQVAALAGQYIGTFIDPEKIRFQIKIFHLPPLLGVGFKNTVVRLGSSHVIHIPAVYVDLDTPSLLLGRVVLKGIRVDTPDLQPSPGQVRGEKETETPFWATGVDLSRSRIQNLFEELPETLDEFDLALHHLKSKYFHSMNGTVSVSRSSQTITLDLNIQGIRFSDTQILEIPILKSMDIRSMGSDMVRVFGQLSAREGISGNLKFADLYLEPSQLPGKQISLAQVESDFKISDHSWTLSLKPISMGYPEGRAGMTFTHDPVSGRAGIEFFGSDIHIGQARQVCLALGSKSRLVNRLFDILKEGRAQDILVSFENPSLADLFDANGMVLKGAATGGVVKIPETDLIVKEIQGRTSIRNGLLTVNADSGTVFGSKLDQGWLELDLLTHDDTPFQGEFQILADLSSLPQALITLLPGTLLARELGNVHGVTGQAEARLILGMAPGAEELDVKVFAKNISAKGTYDRIPLPLEIFRGDFSYEKDSIMVKNMSGAINTNPVEEISARIELAPVPQLTVHSGKGSFRTQDFRDWINQTPPAARWIFPIQDFSGLLHVETVNITGPFFHPENWTFRSRGIFQDMDLDVSSSKAIRNLDGAFDVADRVCRFHSLQADVHDLSWLDNGIGYRRLGSISTPLKATLTEVVLGETDKRITGSLLFLSGASLDFCLSGKSMDTLQPETILLKDGELTHAKLNFTTDLDNPRLDFKGSFHSQTITHILKPDSAFHHTLQSFTGGSPFTIYTDKDLSLHLDFVDLNLEPLIQQEFFRPNPETPFSLSRKTARIHAKDLIYKTLRFSDLQADISFGPGMNWVVTLLNLNWCDLRASGTAGIANSGTGPTADLTLNIQASEKKADEPGLSCLFKDRHPIEGPYSFSCDLTAKGPLADLSKTLSGPFFFHSRDGRIYKATLLSRILSVINILSLPDLVQEGFAYHLFDVQGEIRNGIIHLNKAWIDGENMAMTFTGWISPFEDQMDLTCLVAPFKTIDTIIKYIPIINTALQGRLVSFPAKLQGRLNDPVITLLHPSAVGQGLVNMMTDILKTPIRLFKGIP